jgi:hypothetical protein
MVSFGLSHSANILRKKEKGKSVPRPSAPTAAYDEIDDLYPRLRHANSVIKSLLRESEYGIVIDPQQPISYTGAEVCNAPFESAFC